MTSRPVPELVAALAGDRWPDDDPRHHGPLVTIVVTTRDGLDHLRRLTAGLRDRTAYRDLELVVVDNASTDGTREWLAHECPVEVRTIANDENRSFSEANNQGIAVARGHYCLLLNNDVDPMHPEWLSRLVATMAAGPAVAAAGSLLVYPAGRHPRGHPTDHTIQHAGVAFELFRGAVRARNVAAGRDPVDDWIPTSASVPALTGACLLARTDTLRELGGLDPAYWYGSEDWDLSLRLGEHGQLRLVADSVLFHHEYATQADFDAEQRREYRRRNHLHFNAVHGPPLHRRVVVERLGADRQVTPPTASVLHVADDAPGWLASLAHGFAGAGWSVVHDESDPGRADLRLVEAPAHPVAAAADLPVPQDDARPADEPAPDEPGLSVGVVAPGEGEHIRRLVVHDPSPVRGATVPVSVPRVAPGTGEAAAVTAALRTFAARPRFAIRTCAGSAVTAGKWGDTHFATSMVEELARRGYAAAVHREPLWHEPSSHTYDVVIHLRGLHAYEPRPGAVNVMWLISHAEDVGDEELDAYDLVAVASRSFAEQVAARTATRVIVMHQASDLARFRPTGLRPRRHVHGIVVVANHRWPARRAPRWLMASGWDFSLFGANWKGTPEADHVAGGYVPNDELADIYAQADVVVADQLEQMAGDGFVANRLFDVTAAGGFVISDDGPGVRDVFGDLVPTFGSRAELDALLHHYLPRPEERQRMSHRAMALTRSRHGFQHRIDQLLDELDIDRHARSEAADPGGRP